MDPISHALFMAAASGQPRWVIAGQSGLLKSSDDLLAWTDRTPPASADWTKVIFARNKFVGVGSGGKIMVSRAGLDWSAATSPTSDDLVDVAMAKGSDGSPLLAAIHNGSGTKNIYSADGETWTAGSYALPAGGNWKAICPAVDQYPYGFLVLRGSLSNPDANTKIAAGPPSTTWTSQASSKDGEWSAICYSPEAGLAVAVGGPGLFTNYVMTSVGLQSAGAAWSYRTAAAALQWNDVCWGKGLFVAVASTGSGTKRIMTSPDGINWTLRDAATARYWFRVIYGGGRFVALGADTSDGGSTWTTYVMTSLDGINWTEVASFPGLAMTIAYGEI